jgi:hypothetical protein
MSATHDKSEGAWVPMCLGMHCKGKKPGTPDHSCPYAEEINDDHETLCNCCDACQQECADDI